MNFSKSMAEDNVKKSLKYSIYDGAAFAVMDGCTSSFITPFAIALNASVSFIAALTYIPQLLGAFVQLFAAKFIEITRDRKKILVYGSLMNALLWIPLLLIPYLTPNQSYLLVVYISLQTVIAQLLNPIWNSIMGDIVPKYERGRYFGLRNRIVEITSFVAALVAGFTLNYFSPRNPFMGFTILFLIAFVARIFTAIFKNMVQNPSNSVTPHEERFSIIDFLKKMDKTNYGHFVIYIVLLKFAVYIASPFFSVYMLKNLGFNYLQFTVITAAELIASFVAMGLWVRLIDSKGTKRVIYITGMMIPFIPIFWIFSRNFYYLLFVEFLSGTAWSGFNLATSNFIFDAVLPENRIRCISYYKFFEGIAIFAGAALGGFFANHLPSAIFLSGILLIFLISGVLRLIVSITLLPRLKEARLIEFGIGHSFFKKFLTIRPSEGFVFEVIGKYGKKEEISQEKKPPVQIRQKRQESKDKEIYKKKLMKYIEKGILPKKEGHEMEDMHEIEHITEEIEKGRK